MTQYLIYELFSGVGFYNQLFSLESAVYLANISERKLILIVKFPLCHCGKSSWDYGKFPEFFSDNYKQYLPHGIEIHYGSIPDNYVKLLSSPQTSKILKFNTRFSQIGFVDKEIFEEHNRNMNDPLIKKFLHFRKLVILDIKEWTTDYIYINESNASRCFTNFLTTPENYKLMSNICKSLTMLHESFQYILKSIDVPKNCISIHFRFGDWKFSTEEMNNTHPLSNYSNLFKIVNDESNKDKTILVMTDRKDVNVLKHLENTHNVMLIEDLVSNVNYGEMFANISRTEVVSFLLEKHISEKTDLFIGHNGSTVSNHVQYMNYLSNRPYFHYSEKDIRSNDNEFGWNTNGIVGGGIGWKLFFKDNIHRSNLKIITLTNDGYMTLTHNLLLSLRKLGLEHILKIYCIGEKCEAFFNKHFYLNETVRVDTNEDNEYLQTWVEYRAQQNPDVEGKRRWADITSYKIYAIHNELIQGNDVIFIDGDIVFEKDPFDYMFQQLTSDTELLIQNDEHCDDKPKMCTGFFWMKSNENTIKLTNFEHVQKNLSQFINDQQYLRSQQKHMNYKYLNLEGFPNGLYYREKKPENPYIIHFNYDVSEHKIRRMKMFKKWYVDDAIDSDVPKLIGSSKDVIKTNPISHVSFNNGNVVSPPLPTPPEKVVSPSKPNQNVQNKNEENYDNTDLSAYLKSKNVAIRQGYITQNDVHKDKVIEQIKNLYGLENISSILEIGFLAGHSSEMFLKLNPTLKVTSVDNGALLSVKSGKEYIDKQYPNRHTLLKGESNMILSTIEQNNQYDIIFVDGSYERDIVHNDILLSKPLLRENGLLIVNNVLDTPSWVKYWNEHPTNVTKKLEEEFVLSKLYQFDFTTGRGTRICKFV